MTIGSSSSRSATRADKLPEIYREREGGRESKGGRRPDDVSRSGSVSRYELRLSRAVASAGSLPLTTIHLLPSLFHSLSLLQLVVN